ncbi:WSC domain & Core-2/I-Branching protein [Metarhizium album ARSEF 1941]|uniref:WSC domain & Core-2/I-Branching protein n=1 Tax=Metarhizium album (strain ARSEF 1941) TaxID=1081103 RepID=A0A0B2WIU5_METAS|nr:WSC domain & Core-2/I-Branching protein [Metarhizium album ARSEF 1941]KHN95971.1 WSC domain & Core-2/I-Branching protein [Metarhizium album ARSEF 1941]
MLKDWRRSLSLPQNRRTLACTVVIFFGSLIVGTVHVVTAPVPPRKQALDARQFQLGSILGANALQAMRPSNMKEGTHTTESQRNIDAKISKHPASLSSSVAIPTQKSAAGSNVRLDDIMDVEAVLPLPAFDFLVALTQVFKPLINASRVSIKSASEESTWSLAASPSLSKSPLKRDTPTGTGSASTFDGFEAGGLSSASSPPGVQHIVSLSKKIEELGRRELDLNNAESALALSLLSTVSGLVANIAGINMERAVTLTDAMLAVLPVDPQAIASAVFDVAEQASASIEAAIPFILPAVGKALGSPEEGLVSKGNPENLNGTCKDIIAQGSMVINRITTSTILIKAPIMQDVLKQVLDVVYLVANHLDQILCAIDRDVAGLQLDTLVACDSDTIASAWANILTFNPTSSTAI